MTIPHYIGEALEDFRETLKVNVVNPETSQLFNITNKQKILMKKRRRVTTQQPPIFCVS